VSYHLGNLIPLTVDEKQTLLTAFDADQRFKILSKILQSIRKT
jgi:Lon protease-like protein